MAEEHRRVVAATAAHARALAENLVNSGFVVTEATAMSWRLRKRRRRGDIVTTIAIQQPTILPWAPPSGPATHP